MEENKYEYLIDDSKCEQFKYQEQKKIFLLNQEIRDQLNNYFISDIRQIILNYEPVETIGLQCSMQFSFRSYISPKCWNLDGFPVLKFFDASRKDNNVAYVPKNMFWDYDRLYNSPFYLCKDHRNLYYIFIEQIMYICERNHFFNIDCGFYTCMEQIMINILIDLNIQTDHLGNFKLATISLSNKKHMISHLYVILHKNGNLLNIILNFVQKYVNKVYKVNHDLKNDIQDFIMNNIIEIPNGIINYDEGKKRVYGHKKFGLKKNRFRKHY